MGMAMFGSSFMILISQREVILTDDLLQHPEQLGAKETQGLGISGGSPSHMYI